jgi:hypothetical protein
LTQQSLPKSYQAASGFQQNSKQVPLFNGQAALQGLSPDSETLGILIFTFFCNDISNDFGLKNGKSLQTCNQKIKIK